MTSKPEPADERLLHAHDLARAVHQRAARVPRVDGRIRLDRIDERRLGRVACRDGTVQRADDPGRDRPVEPERRADRDDGVTHDHGVRVAQHERDQTGLVDLHDREVVVRGPTDDRGRTFAAVREEHRDLAAVRAAGDHVVVGEDVSVLADHESRAGRDPVRALDLQGHDARQHGRGDRRDRARGTLGPRRRAREREARRERDDAPCRVDRERAHRGPA